MSRYSSLISRLPAGIDALIVTSEKNQRYLSGFPFTDGYVVATRSHGYLFTDFRYIEAAKRETRPEYEVIMFENGNRTALVTEKLKNDGVKVLAYEDNFLTVRELEGLKKDFPDFELVPVGTVLEDMRVYKDEEEISCIVKAQRIAEAALEETLKRLTPDMTEIEVAAELEYHMRRGGAAGTSFDTIAVSGKLSSCPHGVPRNVKLESGFLTMDFGALYNGYCSDMTRTVVLGKADAEMKKVYDTVLKAQLAALDAIRPGADMGEMDKIARDIIYGAGFEGCFGHSLGHGVGMFIHERPGFSRLWFGHPLEAGHVVTVEPGIYLENRYGVRIEDMVAIYADRAENLTKAPKELIELF